MKRGAISDLAQDKVGAIIAAAGASQRMGSIDKIFADLCGRPLIAYALGVFQRSSVIDYIVLVLSQKNVDQGWGMVGKYGWSKVIAICSGGARRQDSVAAGLERLSGCEYVVVHDGARPLITEDIIERGLAEVRVHGAVVAAVPAKDTVKVVDSEGTVVETPDRDRLWLVQTPQLFRYQLLCEAYRSASSPDLIGVTDDAMLVEQAGHKVKVYFGDYDNIKITTPTDLNIAEAILRARKGAQKPELCVSD